MHTRMEERLLLRERLAPLFLRLELCIHQHTSAYASV
jgi:hypothetical protein